MKKKHGLAHTPEYAVWVAMRSRCLNPRDTSFPGYGARGIDVCARWASVTAFILDMGFRPSPEHSLERRNVNRGYSKANCRWATRREQARNKVDTKRYELFGEQVTLAELAELSGLERETISGRLKKGWTVEAAVFRPLSRRARKADAKPILSAHAEELNDVRRRHNWGVGRNFPSRA
jgi:hypothetical protein